MLQSDRRISLNQSNCTPREMSMLISIPLSKKKKKKYASNAVAPATAKFKPSQILIPLPFLIPRYGCTNGSPGDSASH